MLEKQSCKHTNPDLVCVMRSEESGSVWSFVLSMPCYKSAGGSKEPLKEMTLRILLHLANGFDELHHNLAEQNCRSLLGQALMSASSPSRLALPL